MTTNTTHKDEIESIVEFIAETKLSRLETAMKVKEKLTQLNASRTVEMVNFIHENKYMSDDLAGDWAISVYDLLEAFAPDSIPATLSPEVKDDSK